jgi:hypothetical protein
MTKRAIKIRNELGAQAAEGVGEHDRQGRRRNHIDGQSDISISATHTL